MAFGPNIDYKKCVSCGTCISVCPMAVFEKENGKVIAKNSSACVQCKACEISCQKKAIDVKY